MDGEEDHLSDTQINDIFEKDRISETQTNNIFDNLLTESQIEEMVKDWSDVSQPESDKKDRKRKSEDGDNESPIPKKRKTVIVHTSNVTQLGAGRVEPEKEKNPQKENEQLSDKKDRKREDEELAKTKFEILKFKCQHCGIVLESRDELSTHIDNIHVGGKYSIVRQVVKNRRKKQENIRK